MEIRYNGSAGVESLEIDKPSDFYPTISKKIAEQENGKRLQVVAGIDNEHYAVFQVSVRSGTQNITPLKDTMPYEYKAQDKMEERYLACINRDKNSYKYYHMIPNGAKFTAKYGRCAIGSNCLFGERICEWDSEMFFPKYNEKLGKGYIDLSEYMLAKDNTTLDKAKQVINSKPGADLFKILQESARNVAKKNIHVPINQKLIDKAKELINDLRKVAELDKTGEQLDEFNDTLSLLMLVLQREVRTGCGSGVEENMAHTTRDYARIVSRESDLCEIMESALVGDGIKAGDFSEYGIEVYYATDEQKDFVMRHLEPSLKRRVKRVWRVIPKKQKERFDEYVARHNITKIKNFWHGSRNENWASIIRKGLLLNPDAIITGKMFGKGIYFAPSSNKSFNYTSYYGSSWAHGRSDRGFMGLYAVAYGKPYDVHTYRNMDYRRKIQNSTYDCVHAHAGQSLHSDEIVLYDERAMLLSYVVEFA